MDSTVQYIGYYVILTVAIISTGVLLYFGKIDPAIFASLIALILGLHVQSPLSPSSTTTALNQNTAATQANTAATTQAAQVVLPEKSV